MTSSVDITNRALAQSGTRSQITAFNDGSTEGLYAGLLYSSIINALLRQYDWDFAGKRAALVGASSVAPWAQAYNYPADCVKVRQLIPTTIVDANDPRPVAWDVLGAPTKIIVSNTICSSLIYTFTASEDIWDPIFTDAATRMLAAALTFALELRPGDSKEKLQEALQFAGVGNTRDS